MATFHVRTGTTKASSGAGHANALYIAGEGKYGDKDEVAYVQDGNLPAWSQDGADFFDQADKLERSNGRSGRKLYIAIPNEAADPIAWSKALVADIVKDQAYRFAVHLKDGNPHLHLLFCERENNLAISKEAYFSRQNPKLMVQTNTPAPTKKDPDKCLKVQLFAQDDWLQEVRTQTLEKIREIVPGFEIGQGKELQIGPHRDNFTPEQEKAWQARSDQVKALRADRAELKEIEKQLIEPTQPQPQKEKEQGQATPPPALVDVFAVDRWQRTALDNAARIGNFEEVRALIEQRSNPNHQDKNGDTALHHAARVGRADIYHYLVEQGADPDLMNHKSEWPHEVKAELAKAAPMPVREYRGEAPERGLGGQIIDTTRKPPQMRPDPEEAKTSLQRGIEPPPPEPRTRDRGMSR